MIGSLLSDGLKSMGGAAGAATAAAAELAVKGMEFGGAGGGLNQGGPWGWLTSRLPGTQYDYIREAGALYKNSIVLIGLKWEAETFSESPFCVQRRVGSAGSRRWETVEDHPITRLVQNPHPDAEDDQAWDETLLMQAIRLSMSLSGNAYVYVTWNKLGEPLRLDWIPHWMIKARWEPDGKQWVGWYDYQVNGKITRLKPRDVIHFRDGINPENTREGLSRLSAILREVCTDNEAATFSAAMMRNMGVPGAVISLKEGMDDVDLPDGITPDDFGRLMMAKFTGDRRGEPLFSDLPIDVQRAGLSPAEMILDKVRRTPEARVSAAFRIPAIVLGLDVGLDHATYSNYETALRAAYRHNTVPAQRIIGSTFGRKLLTDPNERVDFDNSEVAALQEDQSELAARSRENFVDGVMKRSESRGLIGLPSGPEDDLYYTDLAGAADTKPEAGVEGQKRLIRRLLKALGNAEGMGE